MADAVLDAPAPVQRAPLGGGTRALEYAASFTLLVLLVGLAEVAAQRGWVSKLVLPAPSQIWAVLVDGFTSGFYLPHLRSTVGSIFAGFFIAATAAITIAGTLASVPVLERVLTPFFVAFQSMPKVAIAPLVVIWFGFGELSKTVIVITACFFPILMNALHGLKLRDRDHLELMRSLGATRLQLFVRLRLPHALPYIFAGLHIGVIFALIGTVVAEFVGTNAGVGYVMLQSKANFDLPSVYACLLLLMAIGVLLHALMKQLEKRVAFWAQDISQVSA
ncbi:ABC transporter permease [Ramlibacter albus]|uniref:ABC transporter permease n=1 Tax=Ramlibacter albus TaxID=2079448 RepID=A0A923MCH8_9BURK|nr:ABC transporter permease [Ramlibacter albus]MBC5767853.1 ABC transporter permease [Ramlibacter albus]